MTDVLVVLSCPTLFCIIDTPRRPRGRAWLVVLRCVLFIHFHGISNTLATISVGQSRWVSIIQQSW